MDPSSDPARILIVRLSHLGDVVCSVGMLHALHAAYPRAEIGWAVQREYAELVEGIPGLARVFPFERRGGIPGLLRLRRALRSFRPDLCVDVQGNFKSALVDWLAGAPRRVGFARSQWQEPLGALLVPERASTCEASHLVARVQHLAHHLVPGTDLRTDLALRAEELRAAEARLASHLPGEGAPVLLHLSSPEDSRGWTLERWEELTRSLLAGGDSVLCLSGPAEARAGAELAARLGDATASPAHLSHWIGQKGLRELAALFHTAARRGGRLVACDSGPMHLAWATGLPTLVLEGPQDARRTGPWPPNGELHRELRSPTAPLCAPCLERRCSHPEGPVCMSGITAEQVHAALHPPR